MMSQRSVAGGAMYGQPATQYALAGGVNIGYQVVGEGPVDLVFLWGMGSNIELMWEDPSFAAFLRRLSEFSRLIIFDRRGCGVSDREGNCVTPTLEERMDDVTAVLDAVGSSQAALLGVSEGGNLAALFAATYPERTSSVILYATIARFLRDDDHPWGLHDADERQAFNETFRDAWGLREGAELAVHLWAPSLAADDRFIDWLARWTRQSISRSAIWPFLWSVSSYDLIEVFPAVRVPTLVLHRVDDALVSVDQSRWIGQQMPDARLVELPGMDHLPFAGDTETLITEIEHFLVGTATGQPRHRRLLTVLFTDIADSTGHLSALGDCTWRELLAAHNRDIGSHIERFGGREIKQLGDGVLAVFDAPARAIRCAQGMIEAAGRSGLQLRAGLHCGECDLLEDDVGGIAVVTAARIVDLAQPGQVLVSSTVRDLVAGSGIRFDSGNTVQLNGIPEPRTVFEVILHGAGPDEVRRLTVEQRNVLRRDGEYWTVAYDGQVVTLRDTKGLADIAQLVASAGKEIHVLDLASDGLAPAAVGARDAADAGLHPADAGSSDPIIDETARRAYQRRLGELNEDIDQAERRRDIEAAARARQEHDALVTQLASAYGLGGRPRRAPDEVERARKRVSRRVRDALRRIERAHPALARHLNVSLQTGMFCSYQPEHALTWTVDP